VSVSSVAKACDASASTRKRRDRFSTTIDDDSSSNAMAERDDSEHCLLHSCLVTAGENRVRVPAAKRGTRSEVAIGYSARSTLSSSGFWTIQVA
jgi:hypothetical protein